MLVSAYAVATIVLLVCTVIAVLIASSFITLLLLGVPYAPTPRKNIERSLDLLELKRGDRFYDLGCGDGRALLAAEKRGANAVGFEMSPWAFLKARFTLWRNNSKAKVLFKNFYRENIADADAVFCFLLTDVMPRVEKKLLNELRPGIKVVSYGFKMPEWQPAQVIATNPTKPNSSKIYLYVK